MKCPRCNADNENGSKFCIACGSPILSQTTSGHQLDRDPDEIPSNSSVQEALEQVRWVLSGLTDRVIALEKDRGTRSAVEPTVTSSSVVTDTDARSTSLRLADKVSNVPGYSVGDLHEPCRVVGKVIGAPGNPGQPYRAAESSLPSSPAIQDGAASDAEDWPNANVEWPPDDLPSGEISLDWERVLGMNWFAIIGAVALAVGVGFFLRLVFENNWIGETGRVILGIAVGLAMLGAGEYTQSRYTLWAQSVTGGAISVLYLSIYAAFGFYDLINPVPALIFLGLVVVTSGLLAIRYESLTIALLGIAGAFLTPILLGSDVTPQQRPILLVYILLVDAGILGVSTFRNWRWFTLVGLVFSYLLFALWLGQVPADDLLLAQIGATLMFLVFVGATTLFHILWRIAPKPPDMALMSVNALAYFGVTFGLLWDGYQEWFGLISLSLAWFYGSVGYLAIRRSGAPVEVSLFALATALIFLTIAMPLQLSGTWITVAWAAQGVVLIWVGLYLRNWQTRGFGLGVFVIAAFRLFVFDTALNAHSFTPVLNSRFPTFAVAIGVTYIAAFLYWRHREQAEVWERYLYRYLVGAGSVLTLWVLSAEANSYFDKLRFEATVGRAYAAQAARIADAKNGLIISLTVIWTLYAVGLLAVAAARRGRLMRWAGVGLLAIPVLKLLLYDGFLIEVDLQTYSPALNLYFAAFVVVLSGVVFAAYVIRRLQPILMDEEVFVLSAIIVAANVIVVWVFSREIIQYYESLAYQQTADFESAKHLTLTIFWAIYSIGIISVGMWRNLRLVRLSGLLLMGIPVVKLFAFDVFLLEQGFRVAAFIILGILLLSIGLVYQRYSKTVKGLFLGEKD